MKTNKMTEHASKVELLREVDIFSQLREYELDNIAKYSEFVTYPKGTVIFTREYKSDALFVVKEGRVGIISVENDNNIEIAQIISKESFGELDFFGRTARSATALTEEENTVLLRFPGKNYHSDEIFSKHAFISASMLYRLFRIISERIYNVNKLLQDKTYWLHDLHKQLLCDKMTGLFNQTYLREDFVNLLPNLDNHAALLMIKPDNFKVINDNFGHDTGDRVLNLMAIFLQSELNADDIGIRYRGDEFAAILLNTDKDKAIQKSKQISKTFKTMDMTSLSIPKDVKIQVSIGIALYPEDADNSQMLVESAHKKMFQARDSGGNRIIV